MKSEFSPIVANGQVRAIRANHKTIKEKIHYKYLDEMTHGNYWQRLYYQCRMWYEVQCELRKISSKQNLYLTLPTQDN